MEAGGGGGGGGGDNLATGQYGSNNLQSKETLSVPHSWVALARVKSNLH